MSSFTHAEPRFRCGLAQLKPPSGSNGYLSSDEKTYTIDFQEFEPLDTWVFVCPTTSNVSQVDFRLFQVSDSGSETIAGFELPILGARLKCKADELNANTSHGYMRRLIFMGACVMTSPSAYLWASANGICARYFGSLAESEVDPGILLYTAVLLTAYGCAMLYGARRSTRPIMQGYLGWPDNKL